MANSLSFGIEEYEGIDDNDTGKSKNREIDASNGDADVDNRVAESHDEKDSKRHKTEANGDAALKGGNGSGTEAAPVIVKNPEVDTSFLPDKEREERERIEREKIKLEWLAEQERIKAEEIDITYSYWDGTGHRGMVRVKKGTTIRGFLLQVQQQWKELKRFSVEDLMYVKEDLIIPHNYTFYDFIVTKARGKSGPLFSFDVYDDVRLVNDATVERDESHAGKVLDRRWYERHKHIFPYNRFEVYDPNKDYGKYTIK